MAFCVKSYGFPARDGTGLIRHRGRGALYPLDMALKRPLSTFPDTRNASSVERARLRRPPREMVWADGNPFVGFLTGPHTKSRIGF